ncbi:serine-rich adhesin for platelets-like [Eriocheir sinensis]|uniref:serine-rich adhesin for platelets-like n=1 Tax=Eriocheir sinensis TaxID=95602 RepID=UPI0021CA0362|nr:serine-rich adhesin for platelets-like [Eriocheir sinensis]
MLGAPIYDLITTSRNPSCVSALRPSGRRFLVLHQKPPATGRRMVAVLTGLPRRLKGGDSTDSVNSILSDAQTASDSTPDLCDACDLENGNVNTNTTVNTTANTTSNTTRLPKQTVKQTTKHQVKFQDVQHSPLKSKDSNLDSPAARVPHLSVSAGGSVGGSAGSSPASGRLTATTRQLPKPQIPTVKSFPNSKTPPQPQVTQVYVEVPPRGKPFHPQPRVSRDSESSSKSATEADSGLGSSSESDRLARGEETCDTDTLDSNNLEFPEDVSELWLREKRGSVLEAGRGGGGHLAPHSTLELAFKGSGSIEVKRRGIEVKVTANPSTVMPSKGVGGLGGLGSGVTSSSSSSSSVLTSPPDRKGKGGKEKRESPITYGMARQKFAPYSRNRFGYYHSAYQTKSTDTTTSATTAKLSMATPTTTTNKPTPNATKTASPPKTTKAHSKSPPSHHHAGKTSPPQTAKSSPPNTTAGLVKSRVALLETTPQNSAKKTSPQPPPSLRKPQALKKPLVRPTSLEKSPLLVMPVSERNIELSKPVFRRLEYSEYERQKDPTGTQTKGVVEDILIVGSVETQTLPDNHSDLKATTKLKTSPTGDLTHNEVTKSSQDAKEREKVLLETSMEASLTSVASDLSLTPQNLSPDGSKILTPQSESSFEILESLSETLDLTIEERKVEDKDEVSTSSTSSSTSIPTVPATSTQPHRVNTHTHTHTTVSPTSDHHYRPLTNLLSSLKSSMDSQSSSDSQRSPTDSSSTHHHLALTNSSSGQSGTCTPILTSARDLDLDFLIDDEIADQPGLTFGEEASGGGLSTSFFGDDEFDELVAAVSGAAAGGVGGGGAMPSPTHLHNHHHLHQGLLPHLQHLGSPANSGGGCSSTATSTGEGCRRPRADSLDTSTSSLAGDDLMLDYEASTPCDSTTTSTSTATTTTTSTVGVREGARPKSTHLRIALPGRRYEEEVMSPDASEIFSEWTAMIAEMGGSERCSSRDGSSGSGRIPRPRQGSLTDPTMPPDPRRPMVLRPPRQGSVSESEGSCGSGVGSNGLNSGSSGGGGGVGGGGVFVDRTTYHYMYQDVTALKTMLLRLRRMLQAADTINPFDANLRNSLYLSLASSESPGLNGEKDAITPAQVCQENVDLRRQVVLLQQQLEDKDRTIRLLQQQLSQSLSLHHHHQTLHTTTTTTTPAPTTTTSTTTTTTAESTVNAATQTERLVRAPLTGSSLSRAASIDDGLGPTVR